MYAAYEMRATVNYEQYNAVFVLALVLFSWCCGQTSSVWKKNTALLIYLNDKVSERHISAVYLKIDMTKDETVAAATTFQNFSAFCL